VSNDSNEVSGVLKWFRAWNDILLIPMFTLILLRLDGFKHEYYQTAYILFCSSFMLEWLLALQNAPDRREFLKSPLHVIDFVSAFPFALFSRDWWWLDSTRSLAWCGSFQGSVAGLSALSRL